MSKVGAATGRQWWQWRRRMRAWPGRCCGAGRSSSCTARVPRRHSAAGPRGAHRPEMLHRNSLDGCVDGNRFKTCARECSFSSRRLPAGRMPSTNEWSPRRASFIRVCCTKAASMTVCRVAVANLEPQTCAVPAKQKRQHRYCRCAPCGRDSTARKTQHQHWRSVLLERKVRPRLG